MATDQQAQRDGGRRCGSCGGELFLGERVCPSCRVAVPPDAAMSTSAEPPAGSAAATDGVPPPDGVHLIVQKMVNDRQPAPRDDSWSVEERSSYDDLADMVRPERDRDGRVVVDLKYALIGAVVVAVICGLVYFRVSQVVSLPGS